MWNWSFYGPWEVQVLYSEKAGMTGIQVPKRIIVAKLEHSYTKTA